MTDSTAWAALVAQGAGGGARGPGGIEALLIQFGPIILILVVFFYLMHRSQKKRDRERQQMLDAIKPRDRVVTIGGVHGRVVSVRQDALVLRVDDDKDVKITVSKHAISRKLGEGEEGASE